MTPAVCVQSHVTPSCVDPAVQSAENALFKLSLSLEFGVVWLAKGKHILRSHAWLNVLLGTKGKPVGKWQVGKETPRKTKVGWNTIYWDFTGISNAQYQLPRLLRFFEILPFDGVANSHYSTSNKTQSVSSAKKMGKQNEIDMQGCPDCPLLLFQADRLTVETFETPKLLQPAVLFASKMRSAGRAFHWRKLLKAATV